MSSKCSAGKVAVISIIVGMIHPVWAVECTPGPIPESWATEAAPISITPTSTPNPITLIMFRHGEKRILADNTFLENGNMCVVGQRRAQRLPARLRHMFGCPDYVVAPNPSMKIPDSTKTSYYYYERPAATIEPTAATLAYPIWMPYGMIETPFLANDLLTAQVFAPSAPSVPKKVFIAWEHDNLVVMTDYISTHWSLNALPEGESMNVNGKTYRCQTVPTKWDSCDFDSIWVLNIQGNNLCYTHMQEHLNNSAYQKSCKRTQ